jgi:hypothetical protein
MAANPCAVSADPGRREDRHDRSSCCCFGNGRLVGVASWLGYVTAIVVVGAMVAVSFGDYAAAIFVGNDASAVWSKVFASALLVAGALLCVSGRAWSTGSSP